jgi:hypothetical protein
MLGSPAREIAISVRGGDHVTLTVSDKRHELSAQNVSTASVDTIAIGTRANIAVVHLKAADASWDAVLGGRDGRALLAFERTDMHGDPGERRAFMVELGEADAEGRRSVTLGTRHEALSAVCDRPLLVDAHAVSSDTLTLVKKAWAPPATANEANLAAAAGGDRPIVSVLSAVASNELDPHTHTPRVPRALLDADLGSIWTGEPGSTAIFRASLAGLSLERVVLQFAAPEIAQRPSELWLVGAEGRALHVPVASGSASVTVPLSPSWPGRCFALVLGAGANAKKPSGVAELLAFTEADRAGGVDGLVATLVREDKDAEAAVGLLGALGTTGSRAVAAHFEELSVKSKRRVLPLLMRGLADDQVRARVLEAVRSTDPGLREPALRQLLAANEAALPALRELSRDATAQGDQAAKVLARDVRELPALLAALGAENGAARAELRRAIAVVGQHDAASTTTLVEAWLETSPTVSARSALALALSSVPELPALSTRLIREAMAQASEFDDRYRLALASLASGPAPDVDAWLDGQAENSKEWMMRHAAFSALKQRKAEQVPGRALHIAGDEYPRVRALSPDVLVQSGQKERAATLASKDAWPLVRAAGIRALSGDVPSRALLRAALEDSARSVRAAAIDGLAEQRDAESWSAVHAHMQAPHEWPEVQAAAMRFAVRLCRADAREDLVTLLRRSLRPDAAESDLQLGMQSLQALQALGGKAADDARQIATRESAPPGLRKAYERLPPPQCDAPNS